MCGGLLFQFILSKLSIDGKFRPRPAHQIKDYEVARVSFRAALSLISRGWGLVVPFYFVQEF